MLFLMVCVSAILYFLLLTSEFSIVSQPPEGHDNTIVFDGDDDDLLSENPAAQEYTISEHSNAENVIFPKHMEEKRNSDQGAATTTVPGITTIDKIYTSREYMRNRTRHFYSWYEGNNTSKLKPDADANGTIIDFVIAGFAKCGTTTMEANLGYIAPMPVADVCTPVHQTVYYSYKNWVEKYQQNNEEKLFRGTKCPAFIQGGWLRAWSDHVPRAKLIVGIRHPMLWFQSFWNMQAANHLTGNVGNNPYNIMEPCKNKDGRGCRNGCPHSQLLCLNRARFHHSLAMLGKTELSDQEMELLGPDDIDGGKNTPNNKVRNPIFLYEQHMLGEDYLWEDLRGYLGVDHPLKHDKRVSSHGKNPNLYLNFCNDTYDDFRAKMMPISYNVSLWLQDYFVPLAKNETRSDVIIPKPDFFTRMVESYKLDPCGKLERLKNGTFVLKGQRHNYSMS